MGGRTMSVAGAMTACVALATGAVLARGDGPATVATPAVRTTERRAITVLAGGDVLAESAVRRAAEAAAGGAGFDFVPLLAPIAATVASADLAICHAELPIAAPGQAPGNIGRSPYGGNRLLAPHELAAGLAATGFDRCSTASNHSDDAGAAGIASTLDALDAAGISHAGTARAAAEDAAMAQPFTVGDGVRVAHLAYTRGSNNDQLREPWLVNYSPTVDEIAAEVAAARAAGAELVIVSIHVLPELSPTPDTDDREFVTRVAERTAVDLVVIHGQHVVQPIELVDRTIVYWSLGNMLSGMGTANTGKYVDQRTLDGLLAGVRFTETSPGQWTPEVWGVLVCVDPPTRRVWPGIAALADPHTPTEVRPVLAACAARTEPLVPALR